MTKERYMFIDLGIWALILCGLEGACVFAAQIFSTEAYKLSQVMTISLILLMRWGAKGLFHGFLGGLVYSFLNGADIVNILTYAIGNLGIALCLLLFHFFTKERIRKSIALIILYCFLGWISMSIGRTVVFVFLSGIGNFSGMADIFSLWLRFFTTESLNAVICLVAILIAKNQNGLFEDQGTYLIRLAKEESIRGK